MRGPGTELHVPLPAKGKSGQRVKGALANAAKADLCCGARWGGGVGPLAAEWAGREAGAGSNCFTSRSSFRRPHPCRGGQRGCVVSILGHPDPLFPVDDLMASGGGERTYESRWWHPGDQGRPPCPLLPIPRRMLGVLPAGACPRPAGPIRALWTTLNTEHYPRVPLLTWPFRVCVTPSSGSFQPVVPTWEHLWACGRL